MAKYLAIDTETTGAYFNHGCRAFMVTSCDEDGNLRSWEWPVDPDSREVQYDKKVLSDCYKYLTSFRRWVFHNAMFDLTALNLLFDQRINFEQYDIHDTMVMAHCHNSIDRLGLKGLALQYLGYPETDEKALGQSVTKARRIAKKLGWAIAENDHPHLRPLAENKKACDYWLPKALVDNYAELTEEEHEEFSKACKTYALGDVIRTMGLFNFLKYVLEERGDLDHYERNRACILPLWHMQQHGLTLKKNYIPRLLADLDRHREDMRQGMQRLCRIPEFNPRSSIQLQKAMYHEKFLAFEPNSFTKKGQPSTDKDALNDLLTHSDLNKKQHLFIKRLLTYRKINTAISYLESYGRHEVNGKLYTNINPVGTITTRTSSRDPNTQNISKQESDEESLMDLEIQVNLRSAFGPPKGHLWICIDYAQLQLRIFAQACQDEFLLNAFDEGLDIHDTVARKVFNTDEPTSLQRRAAKAINFGIIFGAGRKKIERMSGIDGSYDLFKHQFPLVDKYLAACERQAKRTGFIRTLGGYPLRVEKRRAYKACNLIVQGTEGEMVKKAVEYVTDYCQEDDVPFRPIMIIHDEIVFETVAPMTTALLETKYDQHLLYIQELMNSAGMDFGVSTEVDGKIITDNWAISKKGLFV